MRPNWAQGEENYTLKGEEFIQFLFIKSETLDSCRFETKMRQNAPNPISISIFPGVTPQTPGEGREGRREGAGRGKGEGEKGEGGEGKGRGKFASLPFGDRRPWLMMMLMIE